MNNLNYIINSLNCDDLLKLNNLIQKKLKEQIIKISKILFKLYPEYDIIILGIKTKNNNIPVTKIGNNLIKQIEHETQLKALNTEFLKKTKNNNLIVKNIKKYFIFDDFKSNVITNSQYAIFIDKNFLFQETCDF